MGCRTGKDIRKNPEHMARLLQECEKAKKELSTTREYKMCIDWDAESPQFQHTVYRSTFELLNKEYFDICSKGVEVSAESASCNCQMQVSHRLFTWVAQCKLTVMLTMAVSL